MGIAGHIRFSAVFGAVLLAVAACGSETEPPPATPPPSSPAADEPVGAPLAKDDIAKLAGLFDDKLLTGGQEAPRLYRWVNEDVAVFVQFDEKDPAQATALKYVGVSVNGRFCAEDQPGGKDGGFSHFHRVKAADYGEGHGGPPGTPGYWLSFVAVDDFEQKDGRKVRVGVDYEMSPTPPPKCGEKKFPDFAAPGAKKLTKDDIAAVAAEFDDQLLTGGQQAPRLYRWVNEDVALLVQFDEKDPAKATGLKYVGISVKGEFCSSQQPSKDFPHFHRVHAADYAEGHGQKPADRGYWLLWLATDTFTQKDGRKVTPGVDREFSPTPPPDC
jgi:hypothetical protein